MNMLMLFGVLALLFALAQIINLITTRPKAGSVMLLVFVLAVASLIGFLIHTKAEYSSIARLSTFKPIQGVKADGKQCQGIVEDEKGNEYYLCVESGEKGAKTFYVPVDSVKITT